MTGNISPLSQSDLAQRRQKLRRQRRVRFLQTVWRLIAVGGIAGGLVWVTTLPIWLIHEPEQINVEGNRFLPTQTIRSLLPISYPQSLIYLEPQTIIQQLKVKAPISEAAVSRQLFPPGLTIRVKERYPVAIALLTPGDARFLNQQSMQDKAVASRVWLLDEQGMQIPLGNYALLEQSVKLPTLKIIGDQESYRSYWTTIYQQTSRSPVKISEINFQNPANLVLKTELGAVHLGSYTSRFPQQIKTLDQMRKLPTQTNLSQIAYIDLRNPHAPMVQTKGAAGAIKADVP